MILIPRAAQDCDGTCARFEAAGWQTIASPLLRISWLTPVQADMPGAADGVIFTSKNGLRGWLRAGFGARSPVWAVGEATAEAARQAGFQSVMVGPGTAQGLAEQIAGYTQIHGHQTLIHACEKTAGQGLARSLENHADVVRLPVYRSHAAQRLNPVAVNALQSGQLTHVALFSPRMARALRPALRRAGLDGYAAGLTLLCLSPAVANAANEHEDAPPWANLLIADQPDLNTLMELQTPPVRE